MYFKWRKKFARFTYKVYLWNDDQTMSHVQDVITLTKNKKCLQGEWQKSFSFLIKFVLTNRVSYGIMGSNLNKNAVMRNSRQRLSP